MAYNIDPETNDIVIDGFQHGIAENPYDGIADIRSVNIISVPKEASVSFATSSVTPSAVSGSVISADATTDFVTYSLAVTNGQALIFTGGSLPAGIVAGTPYWVGNATGATSKLYTDPATNNLLNITGTGTGTFASVNMGKPRYMENISGLALVDTNGRAWGAMGGTNWKFLGNTTLTNANGNGIVIYRGYLFLFRNKAIDYAPIVYSGSSISTVGVWVYGWNPATGGNGVDTMNNSAALNNPHQPLVGQDDVVYYPDASFLGSFFEKDAATFDPTSTATFTWAQQALAFPFFETAQCLAELGTTLLTGGIKNAIYPWDRLSTSFSYPILIAENNISSMVTVNTNTYIFAGNRGRIYITNGSQANLYKKVPDHLSGTIEPLFAWGGSTFNRNQLYFGVSATTNGGVANNNYGGLWAIDLDTDAIRVTNQLSYGSYAGVASAIVAISGNGTGAGFGLYIGWDSGSSTFGVDVTTSTPYTGGQSYVDSDLLNLSTYLKPLTNSQVEFKLVTPMVSGESIQLYYRQKFSDSFTAINAGAVGNGLFNTAGDYSGVCQNINFEKSQWLQLRAVLTSTASSPSYVRLRELRLR